VAHADELAAIIERAFATLTADEASRALEAAGIASARLRTPEEFTRHPQLHARHRWRQVHTPGGDIDALMPPVEVAGQTPVMGPVPALGQHTEAVQAEFETTPAVEPTT
jgi:crotonobetainyl-CoA:carnitine CoA-transferase CaiB-like acyl-CoA transferase